MTFIASPILAYLWLWWQEFPPATRLRRTGGHQEETPDGTEKIKKSNHWKFSHWIFH
jgi:hypothetical protein